MSGICRPMSQMKKIETKEAVFRNRKRILKYLVLGFLRQEGCFRSAEEFAAEAALTGDYQLCDNIDLDIMLQDYCSYYMMRFNKQPQFCRQVEPPAPRRPSTRKSRPEQVLPPPEKEPQEHTPAFTVTKLGPDEDSKNESDVPALERKPLEGFLRHASKERKEMAELLYQNIIRPSGVSWDDIKGLDQAKNLLMESVVYPVRFPSLFTGALEPWRGVLVHGPPGCGKTLLARAAAAHAQCTFFNVAAATLVNKWRGESEKIVKVLFDMASYFSPSIIFMDEVDSLVGGEHEASCRLRAALLTELDGITDRTGIIFLLANTNAPWDIDPAMLRRLEKRISIGLPDFKTRWELFEKFLNWKNNEMDRKELDELASRTEGYSGSDIKLVCKEALMNKVRKILPNMTQKGANNDVREKPDVNEVFSAIEKTKPISKRLAKRHIDWQNEMGCS